MLLLPTYLHLLQTSRPGRFLLTVLGQGDKCGRAGVPVPVPAGMKKSTGRNLQPSPCSHRAEHSLSRRNIRQLPNLQASTRCVQTAIFQGLMTWLSPGIFHGRYKRHMLETRFYTCLTAGFPKFTASSMRSCSGKSIPRKNSEKHPSRGRLRQSSGTENASLKGYGLNKSKNMGKIRWCNSTQTIIKANPVGERLFFL